MPQPIHVYRPHRSDPEDLEKIFTGREAVLDDILSRLSRWKPGNSRQHHLIIGPRGIGKTALLSVIERRLGTIGELKGRFITLRFAEDTYSISTVADILLEALRLLSEAHSDPRIRKTYDDSRSDQDDERVVDRVIDAFRSFQQGTGKSVVLMLENVNRLFERQIRDRRQLHLLRKILHEEEWLLLICTSPTFLNAVTNEDEPFFEFFRINALGELSPDEQRTMLCKLADLEKNDRFAEYLEKYSSRLRALYHFTGGNPRLSIMLYRLVSHQAITDIQTELGTLLDELTPFYQDRMRDLSDQEAKLLEIMALLPEGCTPTELAIEARMPAKTVRAVMHRLGSAGYVRAEERRQKRTIYIMPERFFRIWHQMNHSRSDRGRLHYLLEFFSTWYATREERDQIWRELTQELGSGVDLEDGNRLEDLGKYMDYVAAVSDKAERLMRQLEHAFQTADLPGGVPLIDSLARLDDESAADGDYFLQKGYLLASKFGRHADALNAFERAVELKLKAVDPVFNKAVALEHIGDERAASEAYREAATLLATEVGETDSERVESALGNVLSASSNRRRVKLAAALLARVHENTSLALLVKVLASSPEPWRRRYAANALGRANAVQAAIPLVAALRDPAPDVRGSAATALGRIGAQDAVEPLVDALQDPAPDVRGSAATALGRIGAQDAVGPLIDALQDPDSIVRGSAATALGRIGAQDAVEPLVDALQDQAPNVRGSAATALGNIGAEGAGGPLIGVLRDPDAIVRSSAVTALGRIGAEEAIVALIDTLDDADSIVSGKAASALGRISTSHLIPDLAHNFGKVIDVTSAVEEELRNARLESFLRSCLRSGDLQTLEELLAAIDQKLPDSNLYFLPYRVASDFLGRGRDPAVLERQHPEMREAALLIVEEFAGSPLLMLAEE